MDFTSLNLMLVPQHSEEARRETARIWPLVGDLLGMVTGLLLVGLGAFLVALGLQMRGIL